MWAAKALVSLQICADLPSLFADVRSTKILCTDLYAVWSVPKLSTLERIVYLNLHMRNVNIIASLYSWAGRVELNLVTKPKDMLSCVDAQIVYHMHLRKSVIDINRNNKFSDGIFSGYYSFLLCSDHHTKIAHKYLIHLYHLGIHLYIVRDCIPSPIKKENSWKL